VPLPSIASDQDRPLFGGLRSEQNPLANFASLRFLLCQATNLFCDPRRSRRRDGVVRVSHPSHLLPECGRHLADEVRPAMSNASYTAPAFGWALFLGISTINVAWPKRITPCCCERGSSRRAWSSRKFPMRRPPHRYRGRAKIAVMAKKVAQTSRETPAKISFLPVASIAFATRSAD